MAEARAALERLCRRHGIATEYDDVWGTRHGVPDATLIALLAAFDVDATSGAAVAAADRAADEAHWHEALPPVAAIDADDVGARFALRIPAALRAGRLGWTVAQEDGTRRRGECDAAALPIRSRPEVEPNLHPHESCCLTALLRA